ncbi:alpha-galactosidase [Parapedobacter sp. 10938]|uniref:alpha-galactosidase n=1 Tax=Parapedobacter flavus TaxID=3110225 RepID=UPI002DBF8C98|nr:alpha-galactosidase [Parapedobacter sp. 10938]MEC3878516.1 alpha-galactosidase [Parapedobacter sp. 10938]
MKSSLIAIAFLVISYAVSAQVTWDGKSLAIENDVMKQVISFEDGKVMPTSIWDKQLGKELLAPSPRVPWFEFVINEQLVHALQPVWKYKGHETVALGNGGTEVVMRLAGQRHLKGLIVEVRKQYFPASSLTREMLSLKADGKHRFSLNKLDDRLHFVFPQYAFANSNAATNLKETRIATYAQEVLPGLNSSATWDQRHRVNNLAYCHMFAPDSLFFSLSPGDTANVKGPFQTIQMEGYTLFSTYEHASQDSRKGFEAMYQPADNGQFANDGAQGVVGDTDLDNTDESLWFIAIETRKLTDHLTIGTKIRRGGYLDGERVDAGHPYETAWMALAFYEKEQDTRAIVHRYIMEQITDHKPSRDLHFYYNTWGMQRASGDVRSIYTEERIKEEIGYAAALGAELFVLDDGWEVTQGVWKPNQRLPEGIAPLIAEIKKQGMIPGIWLSPMGIDATADRYKENPEWIILDKHGQPVKGQWNHPVFDFVGGFYDVFVNDCKWLIDQGVRYFKWDAINSFPSSLAGLHHGDSTHRAQARKDRYDYLLPFYVTRAMRELREYHPDVVVEIDVTEPQRCMVGLMPLQEGKFFWMNNGASGYGDYSTYRAKSMRSITNRFAGVLPSQVFTFAVYPHNAAPFYAQRYNINTTLTGGRGFWGNLKQMNEQQRGGVNSMVAKSKRVLPHIADLPVEVQGRVGGSPELYTYINKETAYGQVVGFSGAALSYTHQVRVNDSQFLGVLNHAYSFSDGVLSVPFQFTMPDDTREAFILGNDGKGVSVVSSTGWIYDMVLENNTLTIHLGAASDLILKSKAKVTAVSVDDREITVPQLSDEGLMRCSGARGQIIKVTWE